MTRNSARSHQPSPRRTLYAEKYPEEKKKAAVQRVLATNAQTSASMGVLACDVMEKPSDPFNLPESDVPSVDAYKKAFLACRGALRRAAGRSPVEEMLKAHYRAPDHTMTAGELAAHPHVDLTSYSVVNSQYGKYAKALCEHLNLRPKIQLAVLVSFSGGVPGDEFVKWTMLPQAVAALESLGWVKKS